jgi:hypothetical protein
MHLTLTQIAMITCYLVALILLIASFWPQKPWPKKPQVHHRINQFRDN